MVVLDRMLPPFEMSKGVEHPPFTHLPLLTGRDEILRHGMARHSEEHVFAIRPPIPRSMQELVQGMEDAAKMAKQMIRLR